MADNNDDILGSKTLEEKQSMLKQLIEEAEKAGKSTEKLQDLFEKLRDVLTDTDDIWEGWTGSLDQVKERANILADIALQNKNLSMDQVDAVEILASWNQIVEETSSQILNIDSKREAKLREMLGLSKRLVSDSQLFRSGEIQRLKSSSDLLGPMGNQLNLLEGMRIKQAEITKDLFENLTAEQANIIIRGKTVDMTVKFASNLNNLFMKNVKDLAQMNAEFNKLNTSTTNFGKLAMEASGEIDGLAPTEAGAVIKELAVGMSDFTKLTQQQQKELTKTVAIMEKLGISIANQLIIFESLTKGLGLTNKQGQEVLRSLESFSKKTNIPMTQLDKNIGAIGTKLAAFGKENYQKVFESLSIASKNLSIEIGKLVQITEQLTTFEGASKMAAELNVVFGKNLVSSMGLLNAAMNDPIQVFEKIKTAMDSSGKRFDELSPAMQRYIASIFGMEVTEAQRLFNQSLGESTSELEHNAKTQKELAELAAKSADVFKRLEIAFQKIMASPLVQLITSLIEGFALLFEAASNSNNVLAQGLSVLFQLGAGFVLVTLLIAKLKMAWTTFTALRAIAYSTELGQIAASNAANSSNTITRWTNVAATNAQRSSLAALNATPPMPPTVSGSFIGLAFAIMGVGVAIGAASFGIGYMAEKMSNMSTAASDAMKWVLGFFAVLIIGTFLMIKFAPAIAIVAGILGILTKVALIAAASIIVVAGAITLAINAYSEYEKIILAQLEAEARAEEARARAQEAKTAAAILELNSLNMKYNILTKLQGIALESKGLNSFASGIREISAALKTLPDDKFSFLQELNTMAMGLKFTTTPPEATVTAEVNAPEQPATRQTVSTNQQSPNVPIQLVINSPLKLEGLDFGRLIYNGAVQVNRQLNNGDLLIPLNNSAVSAIP